MVYTFLESPEKVGLLREWTCTMTSCGFVLLCPLDLGCTSSKECIFTVWLCLILFV
jgi:hypothetical protein